VAGLATVDSITNPHDMFEKAGITSIIARADHVDTRARVVKLANGRELPFDKIILGTGASPVMPPIEGADLEGVFTLRTAPDALRIKDYIENRKAARIVCVGAGFINLEVASLLAARRPDYFRVTVVEALKHALPLMLDRDMAAEVEEYLTEKGFDLKLGCRVTRVLGRDGCAAAVELADGETIEADMVLVSTGTRPNLELAETMGLELGRYGVKVNEYLETSNKDVLAAGDCAEKIHFITQRPTPSQLRGPAVIQGRLAAKRLAGHSIEFQGILNNSAVRIFDKYIAATGLSEKAAREEGFEIVSATVQSRSKHGMIPGVQPWRVKLHFDEESQRLIGGQIVSDSESAVKEIDTVNALILGHKTISDVTTLMCAGNPDCSSEPSLEPLTIAAEQALQKLRHI
jgi:NADPH-dependent 2,4-dienoyl-CoA reductase/sulfur reductase-like enzyme